MIPEEALNLLFWGMIASSAFTFLVSMPLYVLTIWTIARNLHKAPFDSQFFFIFIALGVADIGCSLTHFAKKAAFLGILPNFFLGKNNVSTIFFEFFLAAFSLFQYQSLILVTVNRFCAICLPFTYEKYWHYRTSTLLILTIIAISTVVCIPIFFYGAEFRTITIIGIFDNITKITGPFLVDPKYLRSRNQSIQTFYFDFWTTTMYALLASCVVGYSAMFGKLWLLSRQGKIGTIVKAEIRLVFVGLTLFLLCLVLLGFIQANNFLQQFYPEYRQYSSWLLLIESDFSDMHNQWALFIISGETRKALRRTVFGATRLSPTLAIKKNAEQMLAAVSKATSNIAAVVPA